MSTAAPRPGSRDPRVSVVIPTYNRRRLVVEAIDSVLAQGEDGVEILVVDDGSTDDTVPFVRRLRAPVVVIPIPHCGLSGRVRNVGIRRARGALVALLDSDDLWLPGKLGRQLEYFAAHPGIAIVYTNQYRHEGGRILARTRFDQFPPWSRPLYRETLDGFCVQTSSVMMRREVFDAVGLFAEDLLCYEDLDMWSRLSERYEFGFIETPLVVYRRDVDPGHVQDDLAVKLAAARKYIERYEARRRGQPRTPEEERATERFRQALVEAEQALAVQAADAR